MNYKVHANRRGWIFASLNEAREAAADVYKRHGVVVAITATDSRVTHRRAS
jgi:hypothetical protein